jgi:hypothetical protein
MTKYIAKSDSWFKGGSECRLVADCEWMGGIFEGIRISEGPPEITPEGLEYLDQELCPWDEFEVVEE